MTTRKKKIAGAAAGIVALAAVAFVLLGGRAATGPGGLLGINDPPECPLTGLEAKNEADLDKPAVAVKVENNPVAYPLSGLEKAEVVYEELVEGGLTRFMAIYHCNDSSKVGPVRSSRFIDPAIMTPITKILGAAGGNHIVRRALDKEDIVLLDEVGSGDAMQRVPRPGITAEHTLYANTAALRRLGAKSYDTPPETELTFGDQEGKGRRARSISITFSPAVTVSYQWNRGRWYRSDGGEPLLAESGKQIAVDNVIVEEHRINYSRRIVDVVGTPSIEIDDVLGSGRAVLFRDGRAFVGRWRRETVDGPVFFETRTGDRMVLAPGTTWIELVPDDTGEVKGSFTFEK